MKKGFRLHNLEILNWGTFQGKWSFDPKEETTLLTGDSGSGKSTLVDALTSLLVPPNKIKFNQAADVESKERNFLSYVRGYYGQKSNAEGKGNIEALRSYSSYSVILANFFEQTLSKIVGLAIVFWFKEASGNPSKFYVVSENELTLNDDFILQTTDIKSLRDSLKQKKYSIFNEYSTYFNFFSKKLGGLSEQSIQLFQKTISMKKMGELSEFIRKNMLEKLEVEELINKLINHYNDLNRAYETILKAKDQINMLTPIQENGVKFLEKDIQKNKFQSALDRIDFWIAKKKEKLYEDSIKYLNEQKISKQEIISLEENKNYELQEKIIDLKSEIRSNGGGEIDRYNSDLKFEINKLKEKENKISEYSYYSKNLNISPPNRIEDFNSNKIILEKIYEDSLTKLNQADVVRSTKKIEENKINEEINFIKKEISSLKQRTSNIPSKYIDLKEKIIDSLGLKETDISFAGELIEVKDSEKDWEGAIERFLHSFSLTLLVPKEIISKVSEYIDKNFLKLKIVYYSVDIKKTRYELSYFEPTSVLNKIDIKLESVFSAWIKKQLSDKYNYICCETLEDFKINKKALTKAGQIKSDTRHEKDDRTAIDDRRNYIMGFSNKNKIEVLEENLKEKEKQLEILSFNLNEIKKDIDKFQKNKENIEHLKRFKDFSELDILDSQNKIEELKRFIDRLKSENNILKELEKELEKIEKTYALLNTKIKKLNGELSAINAELDKYNKEFQKNSLFLNSEEVFSIYEDDFEFLKNNSSFWTDFPLTLENIDIFEKKYSTYLNKKKNDLEEENRVLEKRIENYMKEFKNKYSIETRDFDSSVDSLNEYSIFLNKLLKDDLPKYEEKFKKELQENIFRHIISFRENLYRQENTIKDKIKEINDSLHSIDYSRGRYIKLIQKRTQDKEILDFRASLNNITENSMDENNLAEEKFFEIKKIIDRFKGRVNETERDKKWTLHVTDVRNWFHFSATEYWRDTDEECEHYTDSGGKSGGQKEKLAYTILGASLAYNYGINEEEKSSFRLIIIDEAFLKSSDESATFGLELFKKLDFQFIIVTPLLKINTMEPYVRHVGFVTYNDTSHISQIHNLTLSEYIKKKEKYNGEL